MSAIESVSERVARVASEDRMLDRERHVRSRLQSIAERACREDALINGASPLVALSRALQGEDLRIPMHLASRREELRAVIADAAGAPTDRFTALRLERLISTVADGLCFAGPVAAVWDFAARLGELCGLVIPRAEASHG